MHAKRALMRAKTCIYGFAMAKNKGIDWEFWVDLFLVASSTVGLMLLAVHYAG